MAVVAAIVSLCVSLSALLVRTMKLLLRVCLEYQEIADVVMPVLEQTGAVKGHVGDGVFTRLWEARQRGEKLEVTDTQVALSEVERKLAIEALFMPVDPLKEVETSDLSSCTNEFLGDKARDMGCACTCPKCRANAAGSSLTSAEPEGLPPDGKKAVLAKAAMEAFNCIRALQLQRAQRDRERLNREYVEAMHSGDRERMLQLQQDISNVDKVLQRRPSAQKNSRAG